MTPSQKGVSYRRLAEVFGWVPCTSTLFGQQLRGHHSELYVIISLNLPQDPGGTRCSEGVLQILGEEFQNVIYAY